LEKEVCKKGLIYAIDLISESLELIEEKAKNEKLFNIKTLVCDLEKEKIKIKDEVCDLALLVNVLYLIENKEPAIDEINRILKPKGQAIFIEWKPEKIIFKTEIYPVSKNDLQKIIEKNNFKKIKEFSPSQFHYGLIYEKI
jgi:ubiquinone/menaquinone biosynthesis C-methylase UbiE